MYNGLISAFFLYVVTVRASLPYDSVFLDRTYHRPLSLGSIVDTHDPLGELGGSKKQPYCSQRPRCDVSDPYRRTNGQCNNLRNPLLGAASTPKQRFLPPAYEDGFNFPRTRSVRGGRLPETRTVSNNMHRFLFDSITPVSAVHSNYLTHHGLYAVLDSMFTPLETGLDSTSIGDCCFPIRQQQKPEACFSIRVERGDPFFPRGQSCMHFVRDQGVPPLKCDNGIRHQLNERTSFIDGSALYGSSRERESELRTGYFGRMRENRENLLPPERCPAIITTRFHCFAAGDPRVSLSPAGNVLFITWLRRHNLIADALRRATGISNDETLFQETKRIVIAELQHITYNEYLPAMLDEIHLRWFNLRSRRSGYQDVYNSKVDPRTSNAFGAAAIRAGHGEIRNDVGYDKGFGRVQVFPLNENILRPDLMFNNGYEYMARWMSKTPQSRSDRFVAGGLRNGLPLTFITGMHPSETLTQDLIAIDIQRGRDNGVPSYNAFREFCGLPRARFFYIGPGGLIDHPLVAVLKLRKTYKHPDDIDLLVGGITETPRRQSILGPTFQCLIAYQFYLYKHGDRFWYERTFKENPLAAFTPAQLAEIKQMTYAKVQCSTMKNIGIMHSFQPRLMERPDRPRNSPLACDLILRESPIGFDISPFAQQLLELGGRRRQAPREWVYSPLNPGMRDILSNKNPKSQRYV